MIFDQLANFARYTALNPAFHQAHQFLATEDLGRLPVGEHDRGPFQAIVYEGESRGKSGTRIERHERHIDIHVPIRGSDLIGWKSAEHCSNELEAYDREEDCVRYEESPDFWLPVPESSFAIFFPEDGHAPLGGESSIRKMVLKVPEHR